MQWTVRGGWRKEIELELEGKFSESPYLIVRVLKKKKKKKSKDIRRAEHTTQLADGILQEANR